MANVNVNEIMDQLNNINTFNVKVVEPNARFRVLNAMHEYLCRVGADGLVVIDEDYRFNTNPMTLVDFDENCQFYKPIGFIDVEWGEIIIQDETGYQQVIINDNQPCDCYITVTCNPSGTGGYFGASAKTAMGRFLGQGFDILDPVW